MSFPVIDLLRVFQSAIVILGAIVVYFSSKSFRRNKSKSMLFLAIGFAFVTAGAVVAGLLFELLQFDIVAVETIQAVSQTVGFILIVYSILGTKD
jgi:branched-subunit amino acid ABC-type transport system permease component